MPSEQPVCGDCLLGTDPVFIHHCVAAVDYGYPWDGLIARFKFRDQPGWAGPLSELMWRSASAQGLLVQGAVLIPVPSTPQRLAERGYNQAWELCRAVARRSGLASWAEALVRLGDAPDQHRLPQAQRLKNLDNQFATHPQWTEGLRGKSLILVDDVRTTGTTLQQSAKALRQAGATKVNALVLARTPSAHE